MTKDCEVIRDLLPLYHDEVCSEKSRELVEEHLKECEDCRKALDEIKKEISVPNASRKDAGEAWKHLVKNLWIRKVVSIVLAVLLIVTAEFVGKEIYEWDQERTIWMDADELEIGAFRLADGRVYVEFIGREHRISVTQSDPKVNDQTYGFRMGYNKKSLDHVSSYPEIWDVLNGDYENATLIGANGKDLTFICSTDDELPPASAEIEAKVAERDAWRAKQMNSPGQG